MVDTIDGVVSRIRRDLDDAQKRYESAKAEARAILENARAANRANLSPDEASRFEMLRRSGEIARPDVSDIEEKLARAKAVQAEEAKDDRLSRESHPTSPPRIPRTATMHVTSEPRTYHARNGPHAQQFLM